MEKGLNLAGIDDYYHLWEYDSRASNKSKDVTDLVGIDGMSMVNKQGKTNNKHNTVLGSCKQVIFGSR